MPIDKKAALEQIDSALQRYNEFRTGKRTSDEAIGASVCTRIDPDGERAEKRTSNEAFERNHTEVVWRMGETLRRLSPPGSLYRVMGTNEHELAGILNALRADYEAGHLQTVRELLHGEAFSDFLDMATHLLSEKCKDAAAVIAGGVLEQHLRALCVKHGVTPIPLNLNGLNDALYRNPPGAYGSQFMKQIQAWADIRNSAAHGHYDKVDAKLVEYMITGIKHFMQTHPA